MAEQEEKTEPPTGKRKQETRQEGQVAKSTELNSVVILIVGIFSIYLFRYKLFHGLAEMMQLVFNEMTNIVLTVSSVHHFAGIGIKWFAKLIGPILICLLIAGIVINLVQVGFLFTIKPIMPKLDKINPIKGLKNLFSMSKVFELIKNILKIVIIGTVAFITLKGSMGIFFGLSDCSVGQIFEVLFGTMFKLGIRIALVLIILAIIDYIYQRYKHYQQMKMTKHEVKEERKQMEGDPKVKSRIRSLQIEMARRRMMGDVPKATVIITNPTFLAIALKYEMGLDKSPLVLAKGKRKVAEKIKEIAKEHDIPIVEDKPLAQAMYDVIEVNEEIPQEFFTPMAEILAYVYRLKEKVA